MNTILAWFLHHWLFFSVFLFAAGAPALTEVGGGDGGAVDGGDLAGGATTDETDVSDTAGTSAGSAEGERAAEETHQQPEREEPEASEFKGAVSARLRTLAKQAPELSQVFQKYPKIQEQIEATFRREAALREVFPTVAEARQMREHFPNGLADVEALHGEVAELEKLDKDFYTRDADGNYSGHTQLLSNMFQDDRQAAVSLFKTLPKEWARLDPDSYNEVMSGIVGATLAHNGIPAFLDDLLAGAADNPALEAGLKKLARWTQGYLAEKPRPTAEQEQLQRERANFNREKSERSKEEGQRFNSSFVAESRKLQLETINGHPAMKKLAQAQGVSAEKRTRIANDIRLRMEKLLSQSPSFMRKLKPAYESRNLSETIKLQKAAWAQPWLLNKMIREVLRVETPALVEQNRESVRRRAGAPAGKPPVRTSGNAAPTGPIKIGGRWYRDGGKGAPFTTAEVLAGKHLSA
jgi:hypothetical protein